ncbi:Rieske 2Fe-2S domain-containing protein [Nocardioides sp. LHG3406-4]|uniref:Rieske 2Fe-2S domain-containing protein n=1 Tax=Nocardioides sp. LHG3406-4 TaxID=2804575 RepID=UPI003CF501D2
MNERLTQVGPGTPGGNLLRRYWHPVALASQLTPEKPKLQVRILGEDLILALQPNGEYALFQEHCAHRSCSLFYGFLEEDGVRCAYHGWKFAYSGECVDQPFEAPNNDRLRKRSGINGYRVERLSGLIFAYLGPDSESDPVPLLPRWDVLVKRNGWRQLWLRGPLECNWLQIQENTADTIHTYYLHARMLRELGYPNGEPDRVAAAYYERPVESYSFERCEWGIEKTCVYGGENAGIERRPPLIFPNILRVGDGVRDDLMHWRVPVDDENTLLFEMTFFPTEGIDAEPEDELRESIVLPKDAGRTPDGGYDMLTFPVQDQMAWETQGRITDRTKENLGASDRGIAMLRRMLAEQIELVEQGGSPMALVWDEAKNQSINFDYLRPEHAEGFAKS